LVAIGTDGIKNHLRYRGDHKVRKAHLADVVAAYSNLSHPHKSAKVLRKLLETIRASSREASEEPMPARKLRRRLGAAGVAELVGRYEAGESVRQLSRAIDASGDAILRLLDEEGIQRRQPRYLTADEKAEVVRRYQAGESTYQIEANMGVPKTTVARTLQRAGVELRKR
jgi:DNA-directed RNA polymerase specialized sigma24 family protein